MNGSATARQVGGFGALYHGIKYRANGIYVMCPQVDLRRKVLDRRRADLVEHSLQELVRQRVYGLALGYEDLNDHDRLQRDPLLALSWLPQRRPKHTARS